MDKQPDNSRKNPAEHLKGHQWPKGTSGNPKGRPQGSVSLTTELRRRLNEGDDGHKLIQALIGKALQLALQGDYKFFNLILERIDGKVVDKVIHADATPDFTDDEIKRIEKLVEAADDWDD
tara:strand:+ start:3618 stop:3980 length:363 start_codon:yes stop_codon:yes gene_type:complete